MTGAALATMKGGRPVERLRKRAEFLAVKAGEWRRGPYFTLGILKRNPPEGPPRVGYTVTKKQGNAVERNRIRRRLREAMRLEGRVAMQAGHDYVVVARRSALDASFSLLTSALKHRIEGRKFEAGENAPRRAGPHGVNGEGGRQQGRPFRRARQPASADPTSGNTNGQ